MAIIRRLGLSQRAVAQAIGVDPSNLGRWLRVKDPTVPTGAGAVRFGKLLQVWTLLLDTEGGVGDAG